MKERVLLPSVTHARAQFARGKKNERGAQSRSAPTARPQDPCRPRPLPTQISPRRPVRRLPALFSGQPLLPRHPPTAKPEIPSVPAKDPDRPPSRSSLALPPDAATSPLGARPPPLPCQAPHRMSILPPHRWGPSVPPAPSGASRPPAHRRSSGSHGQRSITPRYTTSPPESTPSRPATAPTTGAPIASSGRASPLSPPGSRHRARHPRAPARLARRPPRAFGLAPITRTHQRRPSRPETPPPLRQAHPSLAQADARGACASARAQQAETEQRPSLSTEESRNSRDALRFSLHAPQNSRITPPIAAIALRKPPHHNR